MRGITRVPSNSSAGVSGERPKSPTMPDFSLLADPCSSCAGKASLNDKVPVVIIGNKMESAK